VRAAAIARKVYMRQSLGVGALRRQFGGRNERRGTVPEHFARASGGVIRHILHQLEAIGIVEKAPGVKGGRRITAQGQRDLDLIAGRCERTVEPLGGSAPAIIAPPADAAAEAEAE
jgi:small subunit ribosomal protein S19e